jgi:hypothetical protein
MALLKRKLGYHNFNDHDDFDDDDDDWMDDEDDNLGGSWRRSEGLVGKFLGVEFEVESASGDFMDIINALPVHDDELDGEAPHLEDDGSLDDDSGLEIIFPPVRPSVLRDPLSYFCRSISAIKENGLDGISYKCGMHINVNTNKWSSSKLAVFVSMIHHMPKAKLEAIGGRRLNGYCNQDRVGRTVKYYADAPSDMHAYAVEHKHGGQRLECRFPGATTDLTKIALVSYFVELLEDFADLEAKKPEAEKIVQAKEVYPHFISWLQNIELEGAKSVLKVLEG